MNLPGSGKGKRVLLPQKLIIAMRLSIVLMISVTLSVSARSYSQQVTINGKGLSLTGIFETIEAQTGYSFVFNKALLKNTRPVTLAVTNVPLTDVLDKCVKTQGLTYTIVNKIIVVKDDPAAVPLEAAVQPVKGTVTDPSGKPLPGVTVTNKRTRKSVVSDKDGRYSINADKGDILVFTFIGFTTQSHPVTDPEKDINVSMAISTQQLADMVVVVGYGSTKKKDLTGSVSVIDTRQIEDVPFMTIDNALAGKATGVQITKTDGTPGGAVRIRVRGSSSLLGGNEPLYVIDGVPVQVQSNYISPGFEMVSPAANSVSPTSSGIGAGMSASFVNGLNNISGLNINDIEAISILKDASSTAIYGSKAANGVVIITTKRGRKDMKPQVTLNYSGTVSTPITQHVLDASQYKTLLTEAAQNSYDYFTVRGTPYPANVKAIIETPDTYFGKANTNWIKEVTRNTYTQNVDLAVQGGGNSSKYYSSISYVKTPGVVIGTDFQRVSGKLSLENDISKKFTFRTNMNLGYVNQNISNGVYSQALRARPDYSPYDASGNFANFATVGASYQGFQNPLALASALNNSKQFTLLGSAAADYKIIPDLTFRSMVSLNMQTYNQRNYAPGYLSISDFYGNASSNGGIGANSNSQLTNWFIENTLNWDKTFHENHTLNILAGTSYETKRTSFFSATGTGYPDDNFLNSLSSAATPLSVKGDNPSKPQSYLLSFYLRANYAYKDKYLLTFTGRADGSSKFGPDNKFGYFPSGAVAWRISEENFMKHLDWLEDLKMRVSYGVTGTQNIGDQMYRTLYSPVSYGGSNALISTQLGNSAIKWESTKQLDAGVDFALFKGRLTGTYDYYDRNTDGALLPVPLAPNSSYTSVLKNLADIRNWGHELSLDGDIIKTKDFRWHMSLNITWSKSLVKKLHGGDLSSIAGISGVEVDNTTIAEGQPIGLITGYKLKGIIHTQKELDDYKANIFPLYLQYILPYLSIGDPMYSNTGIYPGTTYSTGLPVKEVIGNAAPKYFGGFSEGFTYKNFSVTTYFTYSVGNKLLWSDDASSMEFQGTANANVKMLDRYNANNTSSNRPRLFLYSSYYMPVTDANLYNASYLKLRTATFNYRFNQSGWMKRAGVNNASVYVSATNLFTITKYPGNDPETSNDPYSVAGGYFDISNYPTIRTFSVGLKAGF
jgi:TonB-linked SusC/RagA family outer membrane protein